MTTTPAKPPVLVELVWDDERRFAVRAGAAQLVLDGESKAGPSPTQALAAAVAGCMATDVISILAKGRHHVDGLTARLKATRAPGWPARLTEIELDFSFLGDVPAEAVERAIQLSKDKYCSVWHSLRQDIPFKTSATIERAGVE